MSRYLYPPLVQPQMVYPDIDAIVLGPLDRAEVIFEGDLQIPEMLIQQYGSGNLPEGNLFEQVMGISPSDGLAWNPFKGQDYNSVDLDFALYEFKSEYDPILVKEKHLRFHVTELREILDEEIQFVRKEGLPFMKDDGETEEEATSEIVSLAMSFLGIQEVDQEPPEVVSGLGAVRIPTNMPEEVLLWLGKDPASTIGVQPVPEAPEVGTGKDTLMNVMSYLSPFVQLAVTMTVALVHGAVAMASLAFTAGIHIAQTGFLMTEFLTTAFAAWSTAMMGSMGAMFVAGLVLQLLIMGAMKIWAMMYAWGKYKKELRKQRRNIRKNFQKMREEAKKSNGEFIQGIVLGMTKFKLIMAEMVARVLDGEFVIGDLACSCDGKFVMTFSVREEFNTQDPVAASNPTPNQRSSTTSALLVGAAVGLLAMGAR